MILFLVLSIILSIVLLLSYKKKIFVDNFALASAIIIGLFPIGGIFVVYSLLYDKKIFNEKVIEPINEDINTNNYYFLPDINVRSDSDIISMEDSLEISNLYYRRRTVLDMLKNDFNSYSDYLNIAIKNEDSETTHYAATSILHNKINFESKMKEVKGEYLKNKSTQNSINYLGVLSSQLKLPYLDKNTKNKYILESREVLKFIVDKNENLDQRYIIQLIELLLEIKDFDSIRHYTNVLIENYPSNEEKYLTLLNSFYTLGDNDNFKKCLSKLKIERNLSKKTLDIIGYWSGGLE